MHPCHPSLSHPEEKFEPPPWQNFQIPAEIKEDKEEEEKVESQEEKFEPPKEEKFQPQQEIVEPPKEEAPHEVESPNQEEEEVQPPGTKRMRRLQDQALHGENGNYWTCFGSSLKPRHTVFLPCCLRLLKMKTTNGSILV